MRRALILLLLATGLAWSQVATDVMYKTARSAALAASDVAHVSDANALFTNPAALVDVEERSVIAGYQNLFGQSFLPYTVFGVSSALPGAWGTVGFSLENSGVTYQDTSLSNEMAVGFSHGFYIMKDRLSALAFGYTIKYYSLDFGTSAGYSGTGEGGLDLGSGSTFGIDVAMRANLSARHWGAVVVKNINQPRIGQNSAKVDLPREIQAGIGYTPYHRVWTTFSLVSTVGHDTQFHAGLEYGVSEMFTLLAGIQSSPNRVGLGFNAQLLGLNLEYGLLSHPVLPETHQFTLQYRF